MQLGNSTTRQSIVLENCSISQKTWQSSSLYGKKFLVGVSILLWVMSYTNGVGLGHFSPLHWALGPKH